MFSPEFGPLFGRDLHEEPLPMEAAVDVEPFPQPGHGPAGFEAGGVVEVGGLDAAHAHGVHDRADNLPALVDAVVLIHGGDGDRVVPGLAGQPFGQAALAGPVGVGALAAIAAALVVLGAEPALVPQREILGALGEALAGPVIHDVDELADQEAVENIGRDRGEFRAWCRPGRVDGLGCLR